jgi:hypothetical protein
MKNNVFLRVRTHALVVLRHIAHFGKVVLFLCPGSCWRGKTKRKNTTVAATRFDRVTSGLWAPRATTAPCCYEYRTVIGEYDPKTVGGSDSPIDVLGSYHDIVPHMSKVISWQSQKLDKKLEECGLILNTVSSDDTFRLCLADDNVVDNIIDDSLV